MFKQVLIAVAATAAFSSGIAVAKENAPATDTSTQTSKTRYCIKAQPVTGSMLQAQQCKTLDQWKALGVDPTSKKDR